jgi:hypothetical protein
MTHQTSNARPWYFWPLIALAVGIVVGLVIGWGIWPVSYKNTLPQDLRPAERNVYLVLVAESYAATGDLQTAQDRLASWPRTELAKNLADLQESLVATNAKLAGDVQALGSALNLGVAAPRPATAPAASTARSTSTESLFKSILTVVLWVVLILVGLAALIYLFNRWRGARSRPAGPAVSGTQSVSTTGRAVYPAGSLPEDAGGQGKPQPASGDRDMWADLGLPPVDDRSLAGEGAAEFEEVMPARSQPQPPVSASRGEPPAPAPSSAQPTRATAQSTPPPSVGRVVPVAAVGQTPSLSKLSDDLAIYQMGESDYDEAFDINDPVDGYMGQCGLQLNEPVGRNRDQAVALQAWLWDSSDPDTRTKVLMSEGAYRDTALRSQQAGGNEALQIKSGTEFEMESHDLLLHGRVEKVEYAEQEPYRGVFAELQVRLQVYRKA